MTELRALEARQEKQIQQAVLWEWIDLIKEQNDKHEKNMFFLLKKTNDLQTNLINPKHFQLFN